MRYPVTHARLYANQSGSKCGQCGSGSMRPCAVDCAYAPWNVYTNVARDHGPLVERATPYARTPFAYLLRFRRWLGNPPDRRDVRFAFDREAQDQLGRNFWSRL